MKSQNSVREKRQSFDLPHKAESGQNTNFMVKWLQSLKSASSIPYIKFSLMMGQSGGLAKGNCTSANADCESELDNIVSRGGETPPQKGEYDDI